LRTYRNMRLVSLGLLDTNKLWPVFTFPQAGFSKFIGVRFAQPHVANIPLALRTQRNMYLVSLGLLDTNKIWPGFTFPQPGFSKNCRGSFPSASWHQHSYRSRFPWPLNMCLGLVDPNNICPGFTFPQASFSTTCWGSFPSASWHQHLYRSRFPRPFLTCATFPAALWTQTKLDLSLLSLGLVSQKLVGFVSLRLTSPTYVPRFPRPSGH